MKRSRTLKCGATRLPDGSLETIPAGGPCALCRQAVTPKGGAHLPTVGDYVLLVCGECCPVCGVSKISTQDAVVLHLAQRLTNPPAGLLDRVASIAKTAAS